LILATVGSYTAVPSASFGMTKGRVGASSRN
jgi:hypothetical protein